MTAGADRSIGTERVQEGTMGDEDAVSANAEAAPFAIYDFLPSAGVPEPARRFNDTLRGCGICRWR